MAQLKEVRSRIRSVGSILQITKAMEMASVNESKKAQMASEVFLPYCQVAGRVVRGIIAQAPTLQNRFLSSRPPRAPERTLLVVVGSDKGLCGAYNANLMKKALAVEARLRSSGCQGVSVLPIGRKIHTFFARRHYPMLADFVELRRSFSYAQVGTCVQYMMDLFAKKEFDAVWLVHSHYVSALVQSPKDLPFLPIYPVDDQPAQVAALPVFSYDSTLEETAEFAVPFYLHALLYSALLDAFAAELGARMTAMHQASDNAQRLLVELRMYYNRVRQAMITTEISEINAGADSMN